MTYTYITRIFQLLKKEDVQTRVYHVGKWKRKRKQNAEGKANAGSKRKRTAKCQKTIIQWKKQGKELIRKWGNIFCAQKKRGLLCIYLLNFDKFTAWHSVLLATLHQRIHILDNDKGSLLQGDNTQMVIVWVAVCEGAVPWPDRVLQAQRVVLPFPHLKHQDTRAAKSRWLGWQTRSHIKCAGTQVQELTLPRLLSWGFVIKMTLELVSNCVKWEHALW